MTPSEASDKKNEGLIWNNLRSKHKVAARPKYKLGDKVRISKYKYTFEKDYTPNWTKEVFAIVKAY